MRVAMSSAHWESSQRPLFVKSVWLNGYRHAILSKEDPAVKCKNRHSSSRFRSGKQTNSARSKSKSSGSGESLRIPAVQLLLANVHRLKQNENVKPHQKKLVKSLTYNVITREHVPLNIRNVDVEVNLTPNTKQLTTRYCCNQPNNENKIIKTEHLDQCSSSLTERVLLWLDLAGRYTNEMYKNDEENKRKARNVRKEKRISTAHPNITAQFTAVNQNNDSVFVRKCTKNSNFISVNKEESMTEDLHESIEDYSILKGHRKLQNRSPFEEQLVTSQLEVISNNSTTKKSEHVKQFSQSLSKRQVHIFMPLVLKRTTENTSVISGSTDNISVNSSAKNS